MIAFKGLSPHFNSEYHLGWIPTFLNENDPDPAWRQIDKNYGHGGGWNPQNGFRMTASRSLLYPGDPPMVALAVAQLREEKIYVYDYGYVAILQPDGLYEVARVD